MAEPKTKAPTLPLFYVYVTADGDKPRRRLVRAGMPLDAAAAAARLEAHAGPVSVRVEGAPPRSEVLLEVQAQVYVHVGRGFVTWDVADFCSRHGCSATFSRPEPNSGQGGWLVRDEGIGVEGVGCYFEEAARNYLTAVEGAAMEAANG